MSHYFIDAVCINEIAALFVVAPEGLDSYRHRFLNVLNMLLIAYDQRAIVNKVRSQSSTNNERVLYYNANLPVANSGLKEGKQLTDRYPTLLNSDYHRLSAVIGMQSAQD